MLDLSKPRVMGILNVTPDSFSDGGRFTSLDAAIDHAAVMIGAGADIIDIGGESTRPGAEAVPVEVELERVLPVIEALNRRFDVPLSIDTSKPAVMNAACVAGAALINDVNALYAEGAIKAASQTGAAVCVMHMQGKPRTMQQQPKYRDVVAEVKNFLYARAAACEAAGISADAILLDPGFGFGKSLEHNLTLFRDLESFTKLGYPLLVGISRKSMIGALLDGRKPNGRLAGSLAAALVAVSKGASVVRVHDVAETVDALGFFAALEE